MHKIGLVCFVVFLVQVALATDPQTITVSTNVVNQLNPLFHSVAVDSVVISAGFKNFNMTDSKLIKMIKGMAPGYLRIGGTLADRIIFSEDGSASPGEGNFLLAGAQWLQVVNLANEAGLKILFDLNSFQRNSDGSWNEANAESFIKFNNDHKVPVDWELGNEPTFFPADHKVNATQLGKDVVKLRGILNKFDMYKDSTLVGPDLMSIENQNTQTYMAEYLAQAGHTLNATTWHSYYVDGTRATPSDFVNRNILDQLQNEVNIVKRIAGQYNIPIWLGETSSAYKGGAPNMSDHFTGSFCWIDKLGLLARENIQVVVRHSVFYEKDHYTFLDGHYDPNPDWWVSVIYQRLVGRKTIKFTAPSDKGLRLYVQCAKESGSLVVFGSNLNNTEQQVIIAGLENVKQIEAYILTSANGTSLEDTITKSLHLNGNPLQLGADAELPAIEAKVLDVSSPISLPPFSISFLVIPNVNAADCK